MKPNSKILANFIGTPGGHPIFSKGAPDNARGALRPFIPLWLEHWAHGIAYKKMQWISHAHTWHAQHRGGWSYLRFFHEFLLISVIKNIQSVRNKLLRADHCPFKGAMNTGADLHRRCVWVGPRVLVILLRSWLGYCRVCRQLLVT